MPSSQSSVPLRRAVGIGVLALAAYSANGREIGTYDSQPTKYTARELVLHHTFTLDQVVAATPALAERSGFARAPDGHYRSAYSVVPALAAAIPAWLLATAGVVDLRSPLAPSLIAKVTASLLTSAAVAVTFLIARRRIDDRGATLVALAFGLGTNLWAVVSQTLWQHETAVFGLAAATWCLARPQRELTASRVIAAACWLGVAGAARPENAPAIAVLALSIVVRTRGTVRVLALMPLMVATVAVVAFNVASFGHPLGAMPLLEALHPTVHAVEGTFSRAPWVGAIGLLVSPSRGLLVFSPVVAVALVGFLPAWRERWHSDAFWFALAVIAQFALYASYTVWWGGHTFGPRYALDVLPMLVPLAAIAMARIMSRRPSKIAAAVALVWSFAVAGTGAFCYPADKWNTDPVDVDTHHARLWDWRDSQIVRCWSRGLSPQNFALFSSASFRP